MKNIFCLLAGLLWTSLSFAQKDIKLIDGRELTIKSMVLHEDRVISVYLPDNYEESTEKYPVLYLLDGEKHFHHTTGAVGFLFENSLIPQLIVVAIHNIDRRRDFLPAYDPTYPTSGRADNFVNFINHELSKYIKGNFRVSDYSILAGHSFGGTFATYAFLTKPDLFDAYLTISPVMHYADNYLIKKTNQMLRSSYQDEKTFYMTVGNEPDYYAAHEEFSALIEQKGVKNFNLEYTKIESERHGTIPYVAIPNGLKYIFSDVQLPEEVKNKGLVAIDAYYNELSAKYDSKLVPSERTLNGVGALFLQRQDVKRALNIFKESIKRFPQSSGAYDYLGMANEANKQLDLAVQNYQKAYDLGKAQNHIRTKNYLINLNRVQAK